MLGLHNRFLIRLFLTNGIPAGNGEIYSKFEYDFDYTTDKFYRPAFTFINR